MDRFGGKKRNGKKSPKCQCTSPINYGVLAELGETGELSVNAIKAHKPERSVSGHKDSRLRLEAFLTHFKHQRLRTELFGK